ncbi:MAG: biotin--[acetyl-CoA-carboxylase] ligase [candidate division Zixibacteria bacterium]|nr:biotin--[acetyl-CoA-carboxylase] ligase [candidate division Zixibacteria bacterium]
MTGGAELEGLADDLLLRIRSRPGAVVSVRSLARRFRTDESSVTSALHLVRDWGYKLRLSRSDVTFVSAPDILSATEITHGLKTKMFARTVFAYRSVKSTNDLAERAAADGAPQGTVIVAEEQTQGRGRFGRVWRSPPGSGVYMSIILRPHFQPGRAPAVSIITALALAETLEVLVPGKVRIKWPNDVLVSRKKVAGILTELTADQNRIEHLIVGVGINVNQKTGDFPEELRGMATSLRRSTGKKQRRVELLQRFLVNFEREYQRYQRSFLKPSRERLRRYSSLIGHDVNLAVGKRITSGRAVDIDDNGCLVIETATGLKAISSGEVTVVRQ